MDEREELQKAEDIRKKEIESLAYQARKLNKKVTSQKEYIEELKQIASNSDEYNRIKELVYLLDKDIINLEIDMYDWTELTNKVNSIISRYAIDEENLKRVYEAVEDRKSLINDVREESSLDKDSHDRSSSEEGEEIDSLDDKSIKPTIKDLEAIEAIDKKLEDDRIKRILKLSLTPEKIEKYINDEKSDDETKKFYEKIKALTDEEKLYYQSLDALSAEEIKALREEKLEREEKLGEKWILKLKIDRLKEEIKELKKSLKEALDKKLSKEEIDKIKNELSLKSSELDMLLKQYELIIESLGDVDTRTEKDSRRERLILGGTSSRETFGTTASSGYGTTGGGTVMPGAYGINVPMANNFNSGSMYAYNPSIKNEVNENEKSENLPAIRKTFKERLSEMFNSKGSKDAYVIIQEEPLEFDFAYHYSKFPIARVEGKYFYHTVEQDGKLMYVREPIENMVCNEKDLLKKIEELQSKHDDKGFAKDYEEKHMNFFEKLSDKFRLKDKSEVEEDIKISRDQILYSEPKKILNKALGTSVGNERKLKMVKLMCGLESAHLTQEVIDVLNDGGIESEFFKPKAKIKNKKLIFIDTDDVSPEVKDMIRKINSGKIITTTKKDFEGIRKTLYDSGAKPVSRVGKSSKTRKKQIEKAKSMSKDSR